MNKIILLFAVIVGSAIADLKDFADRDAFILAQRTSSSLLEPPKELYETIVKELAAIRKSHPEVANIHTEPDVEHGKLRCKKQIYLDKLNSSSLGPIKVEDIGHDEIIITFTRPYNSLDLMVEVSIEFGDHAHNLWNACESIYVLGQTQDIRRYQVTNNVKDRTFVFYEKSDNCFVRCLKLKIWTFEFDGQKFVFKGTNTIEFDRPTTPSVGKSSTVKY